MALSDVQIAVALITVTPGASASRAYPISNASPSSTTTVAVEPSDIVAVIVAVIVVLIVSTRVSTDVGTDGSVVVGTRSDHRVTGHRHQSEVRQGLVDLRFHHPTLDRPQYLYYV
jgi:uncharacterized membrane protein